MYDKHKPLFPFGYGLSYTSFVYSGLKLQKESLADGETVNVTCKLKNTGNFDSDEVVQLYVSFPGSKVERSAIALKGFDRIFVPKGQTVEVGIPLRAEDLKYWDVSKNAFTLEKGRVDFFIGTSSADPRLTGKVTVR
jgi:beta-glucosidase